MSFQQQEVITGLSDSNQILKINQELIWIDELVNIAVNQSNQKELINIFTSIRKFEDIDSYQQYLKQYNPNQRAVILTSGKFGNMLANDLQAFDFVEYVIIFCKRVEDHRLWSQKFEKIKLVTRKFSEIFDFFNFQHSLFLAANIQQEWIMNQQTFQEYFFLYALQQSDIQKNNSIFELAINDFTQYSKKYINEQQINIKQEQQNLEQIVDILKNPKNLSSQQLIIYYVKHNFLSKMVNHVLQSQNFADLFQIRLVFYFLNKEFVSQKHQVPSNSLFFGSRFKKNDIEQTKLLILQRIYLCSAKREQIQKNIQILKEEEPGYNQYVSVLVEISVDKNEKFPIIYLDPLTLTNEQNYLLPINTILKIKSIKKENDDLWLVIAELVEQSNKKITQLSKISEQKIQELLKYNYDLDHFNITEVLIQLQKGSHAIPILDRLNSPENYYQYILDLKGKINENDGNIKEALQYFEQSLIIRKKKNDFGGQAISLSNIGVIYVKQGKYPQAIQYEKKALELRENIYGSYHYFTFISYFNLGLYYFLSDDDDKFKNSLEHFQNAMNISKELNHQDTGMVLKLLKNIGLCYYNLQNYTKALKSFQESIQYYQTTKIDDESEIASLYFNSGLCNQMIGQFEKALLNFNNSYHIRNYYFGQNHPYTINASIMLIQTQIQIGQYKESLKNLLLIDKDTFKDYQVEINKMITHLYVILGDYQNAINTLGEDDFIYLGLIYFLIGDYFKTYQIFDQELKKTNRDPLIYKYLGIIYHILGKNNKAKQQYKIYKKLIKQKFLKGFELEIELSVISSLLGDIKQQQKHFQQAHQYLDEDNLLDAMNFNQLIGKFLMDHNENTQAETYLIKCQEIYIQLYGKVHSEAIIPLINLGNLNNKIRSDKAIEYFETSIEVALKTLGDQHPISAQAYISQGIYFEQKKEFSKALDCYKVVKSILQNGIQYRQIEETNSKISKLLKKKGDSREAEKYDSDTHQQRKLIEQQINNIEKTQEENDDYALINENK